MDPHQPKMHYDNIDDALHDVVMFLGGFKKVAPMLWPPEPDGKSVEEAAQLLRHCLNKHRREKLSPQQTIFLLRRAKEAGFHNAKHYLDDITGYSRSEPVSPADEQANLVRVIQDASMVLKSATERLDQMVRVPLVAVGEKRTA